MFVHARNETVRTAMVMREQAKNKGDITLFTTKSSPRYGEALKQVKYNNLGYYAKSCLAGFILGMDIF